MINASGVLVHTCQPGLRDGPPSTTHDKVFENELNIAVYRAKDAYDKLLFREALKSAGYDLANARDVYRCVYVVTALSGWLFSAQCWLCLSEQCGFGMSNKAWGLSASSQTSGSFKAWGVSLSHGITPYFRCLDQVTCTAACVAVCVRLTTGVFTHGRRWPSHNLQPLVTRPHS